MNLITDYYKAEKLPETAKTRYDVTASTGSYEPFEMKLRNRQGGLNFHFGDCPAAFRFAGVKRPDKAITRGENISSVFVPDPSLPYGFGDVYHAQDAILYIFSKDWQVIELFIIRGQRNNRQGLYHLLCDGELDQEIDLLRKQAINLELPN
jgi:hypothetical protein